MEWLRDIGRRHEAVKKKIHSFRYPLGPTGQFIMKIVYGCIPLVFGYYITRVYLVATLLCFVFMFPYSMLSARV